MTSKHRRKPAAPAPRTRYTGQRGWRDGFRGKAGAKPGHGGRNAASILEWTGAQPGQATGQTSEDTGAQEQPWWVGD